MIKYELHLDGVKQDPRQFNTSKAAMDYVQKLKDAVFKNRNSRPDDYKKNMKFINSLEITPIKIEQSKFNYSVVELTEIGCSSLRTFDNIEQANSYMSSMVQPNTTRQYEIIETKVYES